jgi:hypothetical protein
MVTQQNFDNAEKVSLCRYVTTRKVTKNEDADKASQERNTVSQERNTVSQERKRMDTTKTISPAAVKSGVGIDEST